MDSDLTIKGFVIHRIEKKADSNIADSKLSDRLLSLGGKEISFLKTVLEAYHKKANPTFGEFGTEREEFQDLLRTLLSETMAIDINHFLDFSRNAASLYKSDLEKVKKATGGNLVFVLFLQGGHYYLMVFTMNNKNGYAIDDDTLALKDVKSLDISMLDTAAKIDISMWIKRDDGGKSYLSFVGGNKDLSKYFQSYIGCKDTSTNTLSSKRLVTALDDYLKEKTIPHNKRILIKNNVFDYCQKKSKESVPITLQAISSIVNKEEPNAFLEFASTEKYQVGECIKYDSSKLKKLKYVDYRSDEFTLIFSTAKINDTIVYNRDKKILTISNLPQPLIDELENETDFTVPSE